MATLQQIGYQLLLAIFIVALAGWRLFERRRLNLCAPIVAVLLLVQVGCVSQPTRDWRPVPIMVTEGPPHVRSYDEDWLNAIQENWYASLSNVKVTVPSKLVLTFVIHEDGRITNLKVVKSTNHQLQDEHAINAILDLQPLPKWSQAMREAIGKDHREVTFTFTYH